MKWQWIHILIFLCLTSTVCGQTDSFFKDLLNASDSGDVYFYHAWSPEELELESDTSLDDLQQYDPIRQQSLEYISLGNAGTAHRPLSYRPPEKIGVDLGFHQFDLYKADMRYTHLKKAYTKAYYSQGNKQDDGYLKVLFGRNFGDRLNLSIDYKRFKQAGISTRKYRNLQARNTALAAGFAYKAPRYNAYLDVLSSLIEQRDNGGITTDTLFNTDDLTRENNIPVYLSDAETRYLNRAYRFTHRYNLLSSDGGEDKGRQVVRLSHRVKLETDWYKFFDPTEADAQDSLYYGNLLVDDRGLRHFIRVRQFNTQAAISFLSFPEKKDPLLRSTLLSAGIRYASYDIYQEPETYALQNAMIFGKVRLLPRPGFSVYGEGEFALLDNAGDFRILGQLQLDLKDASLLKAGISTILREPSLLHQRLFISQQQLWIQDFKKSFSNRIFGGISWAFLDLDATLNYYLLRNYLYFDEAGIPQQESNAFNVLQLMVEKDFAVGPFHLENRVVIQSFDNSILGMPALWGRHSLYFEGPVFKKALLLRAGADLRWHDEYKATRYLPLTGQFILDDQLISSYPITDIFLSFKVTEFRAFFKMENIASWWLDEIYYASPDYPLLEGNFRFGISWQLWN